MAAKQVRSDLTCSWCGTLRGSLRFGKNSLVERTAGDFVICDLCVADLYRLCVDNFGPDWPFTGGSVKGHS